jgi:MFS family permease
MADTGHSLDQSRSASNIRNSSGSLTILVLAFAPQIFELAWSLAAFIFRFPGGRDPVQVLSSHLYALVSALPALIGWIVGLFGENPTVVLGPGAATSALSSDVLLALIYSYPLVAIAAFTLFVTLRAPQDYFGGIVMIAIGLFALWASSDLQGMHGFSFGAGTAPRMFAVLLVMLGAGIALVGLVTEGPHLATYAWRGPLFVSLSILSFAITIRPLGLVISAFLTFMVAALGTHETKWKETIIVGIALTAFCSFLFPYGLGLPMQLWPRFLIQ